MYSVDEVLYLYFWLNVDDHKKNKHTSKTALKRCTSFMHNICHPDLFQKKGRMASSIIIA
jgi:hypothetical protein